jgi:S1-C subfamily serine protease
VSELLQQLNTEMAVIVERVRDSLVEIKNGHGGIGAGTIWHSEGLIVTNAHVVGRRHLRVSLADGRTLPAQLLAHNQNLDLAALKVDANELSTIQLGRSDALQPGQLVLAVGHPWGIVGAVTAGVIIGLGPHPEGILSGRDMIQVNLPLRPGYSGGPLVDVYGRLVGINTMMNGPQVGLAVPVHQAKRFLHQALGS